MLKLKNKNMKNNYPLISIITPSYNQGQFIEETIRSVQNQTYKNFEHIVIDGGSTDNTLKILKKYTGKIKWISEKDKGQPDALNKGFKMAKGDIVCYLCADDYYQKDTLATVVDFFKRNKEAKILTADYTIIDEKNNEIHSFVRLYKKIFWLINSYYTFLFVNYVNQPSTFWKKELFDEFGYFDIKYQYEFDYEWWLRVSSKYKIFIINKKLSFFRLHKSSKSGSRYIKQFVEDYEVVENKTDNKLLLFFKKNHNNLIVNIYKLIRF
jgi:glycosyltransferase involved in cell wall biosynthesis